MNKLSKFIIFSLIVLDIGIIAWLLLHGKNIALFNSQGLIAQKERNLIITEVAIMLIIVIPVFILTFFTAWKYRAGNSKIQHDYAPDSKHSILFELGWWAFPTLIVLFLGTIMWKATHQLDPYKPLIADSKPLTIQVVALRWKWLFIYPEQNIATVNFIQIPEQTPINFELTADAAPMSSFWIPNLSGQMYAMTGMETQLHLMANRLGEYTGSTAEINGQGFSDMRFVVKSTSKKDFDFWVQTVKQSHPILNHEIYTNLVKLSEGNQVTLYASVEKNLYNQIMMKYMGPTQPMQMDDMKDMKEMDMKGMHNE